MCEDGKDRKAGESSGWTREPLGAAADPAVPILGATDDKNATFWSQDRFGEPHRSPKWESVAGHL